MGVDADRVASMTETRVAAWHFSRALFGKLAKITKNYVVSIDILLDDRFGPSADTIGCLALGH